MKLMDRNLIRRDSGIEEWKTTQWVTTEKCWSLLIDRVGISSDGVGDVVGQEKLLALGEFPREKQTRVLDSPQSNTQGETQQFTLTGDKVDVDTVCQNNSDIDRLQKCIEAAQLGDPEVREKRRQERDSDQTSLIEWSDVWDVTIRAELSVEPPSGAVY
ncbi:hypothetical protein [Halobacterium sp. NMX12-1]